MATKLISAFVKVATSGPTVDGREISADDLVKMAASYSKDEYTALIWWEHYRGYNFGSVEALEAKEDDKGRMCLYAQLCPNMDMIELNRKHSQKMFTSIEIMPNFANTGEPYLMGLAITDSPASLGTQLLEFNSKNNEQAINSDAQDITEFFNQSDDTQQSQTEEMPGWFKRVMSKFNNEDDTMSKAALEALQQKFTALTEKVDALEKHSSQKADGEGDEGNGDNEEITKLNARISELEEKLAKHGDNKQDGVDAESFKQIKDELSELSEAFNTALESAGGNTELSDVDTGAEQKVFI